MRVVVKNDSNQPMYIKFENEPDLNLDPGAEIEVKLDDGSQVTRVGDHIETKSVKRPV